MTLRDARLEVINGLKSVSGIRATPTKIPEGTNPFPFAVAHGAEGEFTLDAATLKVGLHDIMVELHVGRDNLSHDYDVIEPLIDTCASKWLTMLKNKGSAGGFQYIEYIDNIGYSIQPGQWAGVPTLMVVFTLYACKVQNAV